MTLEIVADEETIMDITKLFLAILSLLAAVITTFVVPWIKSHTTLNQQTSAEKILDTLVHAAEQLYKDGAGDKKLQAVKDWLAAKNITIDETAIEAAVLRLHGEGLNWASLHPDDTLQVPTLTAPAPPAEEIQP
jgi:hypothetical protein